MSEWECKIGCKCICHAPKCPQCLNPLQKDGTCFCGYGKPEVVFSNKTEAKP